MAIAETPQLELLTVPEAAAILRVSRATVYRLANDGELPAHRVGAGIRFDRGELTEFALRPFRVEEDR
jgi:excisionase family DNA binding protein